MGRFFQLPHITEDSNHSMAKKVVKRHGGLETPKNSLELPVESLYSLYAGKDSKLYSSQSMKESSKKKCCSTEAPIKKLISEEISKRSNVRSNAPSIVARLMGVDMLPVDLGQDPKMVGRQNETPAVKYMEKERSRKDSDVHDSFPWDSSPKHDLESFGQDFSIYSDHCSSHVKMSKPKRREHPQEQELQKFKKEFEAWQAARFTESSKVVELSNSPSQSIAQDDLKETKFCYDNSKRMKSFDNMKEPKYLTMPPYESLTSRDMGKKRDYLLDGINESFYTNKLSKIETNIQSSRLLNSNGQLDMVSAPTKIVILRPGPDRIGVNEDSWNSTPSTFEERGRIQDFLEEVKERLKTELQGKSSKRITTARGGGIETPYQEKPLEPRQIAQRIAQQVRDSVKEDFGKNLHRSESTRYRSDIELNGTDSPEFMNIETRKLLTERLKNVLKGETHREVPTFSHKRLSSSVLNNEKSKAGQSRDTLVKNKMGCSASSMYDLENLSRSFRESSDDCGLRYKEPSSGSLVRSLSAPVSGSGTSLGKLLLEDRHIFTGAQIRMKHEVVENVIIDVKKQKRDKFKLREKVSSFGYSLTLRGKLFRRRVQSVDDLQYNSDYLFKDIASGPTVMMSSYETHENSTEVPPSPASICSSVSDDLWRPAILSSPASSVVSQVDDGERPYVFDQINSNLIDLRKQLDHLKSPGLEEPITTEEKPQEVEIVIEDPNEAYVRELLLASGYYDGSCNRSLSKWDPLGKPISNEIFEEVEESYRQRTKANESSTKDQGYKINNRLIFDLLNEALPTVLRQSANMLTVAKAFEPRHHQPPHGRELLHLVWETIRSYVHRPAERSYYALETLLAQDLKEQSLSRLMNDDVNALGKDLEYHITGDLIEEIVEDFYMMLLT